MSYVVYLASCFNCMHTPMDQKFKVFSSKKTLALSRKHLLFLDYFLYSRDCDLGLLD